jgi:hypothetical protein
VKRYDSKSAPRCKAVKTRIQRVLKSLQFIVDSNSQCLKYTGCCFYPTLSSTCCNVIKTCLCSQELQLSMKKNYGLRQLELWILQMPAICMSVKNDIEEKINMLDRVMY